MITEIFMGTIEKRCSFGLIDYKNGLLGERIFHGLKSLSIWYKFCNFATCVSSSF